MADEGRQLAGERLQEASLPRRVTARRKAERLILEGRVSVNGTVVRELAPCVWGRTRLDDGPARLMETVMLALFKPKGA